MKGYQECPFTVRTGEVFSLEKKFVLGLVYTRKNGENDRISCYLKDSVLDAKHKRI